MKEAVHALMMEKGRRIHYLEVARRMLQTSAIDPDLARRVAACLFDGDARFRSDAEGYWYFDQDGEAQDLRMLRDTTYVVVDIETTGGKPPYHKITEIAALKLHHGHEIGHFQALVNPGRSVPPVVVQLTGISDAMLTGQPPIEQVLPRFLEFVGDGVFVGHNVYFDLNFLNYDLLRITGRELELPYLCTYQLARRLLPHLPKKSLESVARHLGISIPQRHRALGDARAAGQILLRFLDEMGQRGVLTLRDAIALQRAEVPAEGEETDRLPASFHTLPEKPGVFLVKGDKSEILFLGRAKNLRKRVRQIYLNPKKLPSKMASLVEKTRQIDFIPTGSELSALLLEGRLIRESKPPYNLKGWDVHSNPYLKISRQQRAPRFYCTRKISNDNALYFGPFASVGSVKALVKRLNLLFPAKHCRRPEMEGSGARLCAEYDSRTCGGRCMEGLSPLDLQLLVEQAILELEKTTVDQIAKLQNRLARATRAMHQTQTIRLRNQLAAAERYLNDHADAKPVSAKNLIVAEPGMQVYTMELSFVRGGSLCYQMEWVYRNGTDNRLTQKIEEIFFTPAPPRRLTAEEVAEMNLIAGWLHPARSGSLFLDVDEFPSAEAVVHQLHERFIAMHM